MEQHFTVSGMTCGHCVRAVTVAIQEIDPAAVVRVDLAAGLVTAHTGAASDRIAAAIRGEGYTVIAEPTP